MDFKMSIVAASLYGLTCMLLGGFYQKHIPPWLSWIQYTAYITFSYDAALSIEFTDSPPFRWVVVVMQMLTALFVVVGVVVD